MACYKYKKGRRGIYMKKARAEVKKYNKSKYNIFGRLLKRVKKVL